MVNTPTQTIWFVDDKGFLVITSSVKLDMESVILSLFKFALGIISNVCVSHSLLTSGSRAEKPNTFLFSLTIPYQWLFALRLVREMFSLSKSFSNLRIESLSVSDVYFFERYCQITYASGCFFDSLIAVIVVVK